MYSITPLSAKLCAFSAPKNRILFGERLEAVRKLENSVLNHGLFNPIIVMKEGLRLIVVDGSKRLTALRRLLFQGKLPQSLKRVPYIVVEQCRQLKADYAAKPLKLLSNREHYDLVTDMYDRGHTAKDIANQLFVKTSCVRDILNIKNLSTNLRTEFIGNRLSLDQARALASLQDHRLQDAIIHVLGPCISADEILKTGARVMKKIKASKQVTQNKIIEFSPPSPNKMERLAA